MREIGWMFLLRLAVGGPCGCGSRRPGQSRPLGLVPPSTPQHTAALALTYYFVQVLVVVSRCGCGPYNPTVPVHTALDRVVANGKGHFDGCRGREIPGLHQLITEHDP